MRHHIPAVWSPVHVFCVRGANGGMPALPRPDSAAGAPQMIAQNAHICRGRDLPIGARDELPETALCRINLQKCVRAIHCGVKAHKKHEFKNLVLTLPSLKEVERDFSGCALFLLLFQKALNFFIASSFRGKFAQKLLSDTVARFLGTYISEDLNPLA